MVAAPAATLAVLCTAQQQISLTLLGAAHLALDLVEPCQLLLLAQQRHLCLVHLRDGLLARSRVGSSLLRELCCPLRCRLDNHAAVLAHAARWRKLPADAHVSAEGEVVKGRAICGSAQRVRARVHERRPILRIDGVCLLARVDPREHAAQRVAVCPRLAQRQQQLGPRAQRQVDVLQGRLAEPAALIREDHPRATEHAQPPPTHPVHQQIFPANRRLLESLAAQVVPQQAEVQLRKHIVAPRILDESSLQLSERAARGGKRQHGREGSHERDDLRQLGAAPSHGGEVLRRLVRWRQLELRCRLTIRVRLALGGTPALAALAFLPPALAGLPEGLVLAVKLNVVIVLIILIPLLPLRLVALRLAPRRRAPSEATSRPIAAALLLFADRGAVRLALEGPTYLGLFAREGPLHQRLAEDTARVLAPAFPEGQLRLVCRLILLRLARQALPRRAPHLGHRLKERRAVLVVPLLLLQVLCDGLHLNLEEDLHLGAVAAEVAHHALRQLVPGRCSLLLPGADVCQQHHDKAASELGAVRARVRARAATA